MTSKEHKIMAKEALSGNWGLAIGLLLLSLVLPSALVLIPIIGPIAFIIFAPAIAYVPMQLYLKLKRKEEVKITDFFNYAFSKRLGKYWTVSLWIGIVIIGITIILFAVGSLINTQLTNISSTLGNIGTIIFTTILYIVLYYFAFRYSQVAYIMYDNPELKTREIIKKSAELMKGNMLKLLCLYLSFIGWVILSVFTFGLAYFYVLPYLYTALGSFYDGLIGNNNTVIIEE